MKKRRHIEIEKARDTSTGEVIEFAPGTDREETSRRWATLWDRVDHEMWAEWAACRPGNRGSQAKRFIE